MNTEIANAIDSLKSLNQQLIAATTGKKRAEIILASKETKFKKQDFVKERTFVEDQMRIRDEILKTKKSLLNYARQLESLGVVRSSVRQSLEKQIEEDMKELLKSL